MLQVGSVQIDVASREIRADGNLIDIEPKAYALLIYLIQQRDRVVKKAELLEQVWPGRVVTDDALYRAIRLARNVFSDCGIEEPAIRTVHRVGYRFVAAVSEAEFEAQPNARFLPLLAVAGNLEDIDLSDVEDLVLVKGESAASLQFETVDDALAFALSLQNQLKAPEIGIGLHVGASDASDQQVEQFARKLVDALAAAAKPVQILLSATGFEFARSRARDDLAWRAHGAYRLAGIDEVVTLYEVGLNDKGVFEPPAQSKLVQPVYADDLIPGWRAAAGQEVPHRAHWILQENLGSGGFGEAWMAEHAQTREKRVFKFCFRTDRLSSLQREVTLFRLLNETIGARDDIARILDWNFEQAPYFVESEYTAEGDLIQWAERQGGIQETTLNQRLDLIVRTARALAAAHAVGVLHKDVKPANILIAQLPESGIGAVLADFGIGLITDPNPLIENSITQLGITDALAGNITTARTGTRRYMAPELLEGRPPTLQADIYSLGVVLFQIVVGDFDRVLAPGWERSITDEILRDDISAMVDGDPDKRIADAGEIVRRLSTLEARRARRSEAQQQKARLQAEQKRRRILIPAIVVTGLFAVTMSVQNYRVSQQKARAELEAQRAQEVAGFINRLFDAGNPMYRGGSPPTLSEFLINGGRQLRTDLETEPAVRATLLRTLGSAMRATNDLEDAEALLEIAALDAQSAGDTGLEVNVLLELAKVGIERNELDTARARIEEARSLMSASPDSDQLPLASLQQIEARLLYLNGSYETSVDRLRASLSIRRDLMGIDDPRLADSIANLGGNLFERGSEHHAEAEVLFRESINLFERYNPRHYGHQAARANLGVLLETLGRSGEAIEQLEQAILIADEIFGGPHPITAWALQTIGEAHLNTGNPELAKQHLERSLSIRRETRGSHFETALSLRALADFQLAMGNLALAEAYAGECFEMRKATLPAGHVVIAEARHRVALVAMEQGRIEKSAEILSEVVNVVSQSLGDTHWFTGQVTLDLAQLQALQGRSADSLSNGRQGLDLLIQNFGDTGMKTGFAQFQWASVLSSAGRLDEARQTLESAWPSISLLEAAAPYRYKQAISLKAALAQE